VLEDYIKLLKLEIQKLFQNDSSGHDITHLERTMNNALFLQKYEGGDLLIVGIAAFLHDIHRIMQNESGKFVSPKDSLPKAREMLLITDLSEEQVNSILHCIEFHEEYNWNNPNNKQEDINTLILQDADNLDAIGAIGIGRTFIYSGSHGRPMYDSSVPLKIADDYAEDKGDDESTIHHFYHKLFKLGANMNTKTAKKLADKKTMLMHTFVDEFLMEWNGNYKLDD
jgi:uncharacterized protein